jgi:hypothetical protein
MSGARVFPFLFRGDDSRRMRVVITTDNDVCIESFGGRDALGAERWLEMIALAVAQPCQTQPAASVEQHYHFSTGGGCPITVTATAHRVCVNGDDVEVTP